MTNELGKEKLTDIFSDTRNGQSARNPGSAHGPTRRSFHQTLMISLMLANNPSHDCSQGQLDDFESLPSIAKRHCHESNVMLRSAFSHQKFLQPVNTARLSRTLNIGNPTIARKVLGKANKDGTTSVDEMFSFFFPLPLFFCGGVVDSRRSLSDQNFFDMKGSRHCRSFRNGGHITHVSLYTRRCRACFCSIFLVMSGSRA